MSKVCPEEEPVCDVGSQDGLIYFVYCVLSLVIIVDVRSKNGEELKRRPRRSEVLS